MKEKVVRVLIVDDQQLLRRGLTMLLGTVEGIQVVGEAAHGAEALAFINAREVDVVVTDAKMPVMGGVELVEACARDYPDVPVLVLTTFDEPHLVRGAVAAGASGFLLKDTSTHSLAQAIRAAAEGGLVIDPRVARHAMGAPGPGAAEERAQELAILTKAERAVAELVAEGATNAEIAMRLHLAEGTVKNHVSALLRKTGERHRAGLALALYKDMREGP